MFMPGKSSVCWDMLRQPADVFPGRAVNTAVCFTAACQAARAMPGQGRLLVCISHIPGFHSFFNDSVVK